MIMNQTVCTRAQDFFHKGIAAYNQAISNKEPIKNYAISYYYFIISSLGGLPLIDKEYAQQAVKDIESKLLKV